VAANVYAVREFRDDRFLSVGGDAHVCFRTVRITCAFRSCRLFRGTDREKRTEAAASGHEFQLIYLLFGTVKSDRSRRLDEFYPRRPSGKVENENNTKAPLMHYFGDNGRYRFQRYRRTQRRRKDVLFFDLKILVTKLRRPVF
jgi:hypothetical protein